MCLVFMIWETHSYLPARGRVGYMTHKKSEKSQFCGSMAALHLTAFTARGLETTWQMAPESPMLLSVWLLQGTWQASDLGWKEMCHRFSPASSQTGAVQSCKVPSTFWSSWGWWMLWAVGSTEIWVASSQIHFMKRMGKRQAHHSLCHIIFSFDCCKCRPKIFFFHF